MFIRAKSSAGNLSTGVDVDKSRRDFIVDFGCGECERAVKNVRHHVGDVVEAMEGEILYAVAKLLFH